MRQFNRPWGNWRKRHIPCPALERIHGSAEEIDKEINVNSTE